MDAKEDMISQVAALGREKFAYTNSQSISDVTLLDTNTNALLMEGPVLFVTVRNMSYVLREYGKRTALRIYKMCHAAIKALSCNNGAFVHCESSNAFLIVFPDGKESVVVAMKTALRLNKLLNETLKDEFDKNAPVNISIGADYGHILGAKVLSDNETEQMVWTGACIEKAKAICNECEKPYFVGISRLVYNELDDSLKVFTKHILGIPKKVEIWSRISYQFENKKKHLYQTNYRLDLETDTALT